MAVNIFQVQQINSDLFTSGRPSNAGVQASEYPLFPDNINGNLSRYTEICGIWSSSTQNNTGPYPAGVGGDSWSQPNGFGIAGRPNGGYFVRAVLTSDQNVNYGYIGSFVGGYGNLSYTFDLNPGPITSPTQVSAVDYEPPYGHGTSSTIALGTIPNSTASQWRDASNLTVDATAQLTMTSSAYSRTPYTQPAMFVAQIDSPTNNISSGNVSFHVEMRPTQQMGQTLLSCGLGCTYTSGSRAPFRNDQYGYPLGNLPDDFYAASNNRKFGSRALSIFWGRVLDGSMMSFAYPYYEDQSFATSLVNPSGPSGANTVALADHVFAPTAIADCPTSRAPQNLQNEWLPNTVYPLNYEILDPWGHIEKVITAGTSGSSRPSVWFNPPEFGNYGDTPDGPNTLVWQDNGSSISPVSAYQTDIRVRHHASLHVNDEYDLFVQETKFAIFTNKAPLYPLVFIDLLDTWNSGTWAQGFRIAGAAVWSESTLWQTATGYVVGQAVLDTNGNIQVVTAISGSGTSGGPQPTWNATYTGTTTDNPGANQVVWTNYGGNKSKIFFVAENGSMAMFDSNVVNSTVTALTTAPALASGAAYGACRIQTGYANLYTVTGSMGINPLNSSTDSTVTPGAGYVGVTPYSIVAGTWGSASFPAFNARHNARSLSEIIKLRNGNFAFAVENVAVSGTTVTNIGVASVTNVSLTSNVVTISTTFNNFTPGQFVFVNGLTNATFLQNATLIVLSTGLSNSQFTAAFTHANYGSTSDTGTARDIEWQVMLYNPTSNTWNVSQITGGGGVNFSYMFPGLGASGNGNLDQFLTYEQQFNCTLLDVADTIAGNGQPVILMQCNWRDDRLFVIDGSQSLSTISDANVSWVGKLNAGITNISESAGSVVTVTAGNFFQVGQEVYLSGITHANWLNGLTVTVLSTGLSNSVFEFNDPTLHGSYPSASDTGNATHLGIFPALPPLATTPLQIRKSVTDDRTLFWLNEEFNFNVGSAFYVAPPSWTLANWNQTTVGGMETISPNATDGNDNITTIATDHSFLSGCYSGQGISYVDAVSFLGAFTDNTVNVVIHGGVDPVEVLDVGQVGEYGLRSNSQQGSGIQIFGHNMEQGGFYMPTYFKWNGSAFTMADSYADAVANPAPVPSSALTSINLPYGLVAQFGQTGSSTFHQYEWFTINVAWGNTKYVRKARYVWSMFAGQTFNNTQFSIPMSAVSGASQPIPTMYLADAFGPSNITFPSSFTNPLTLQPVASHPASFTTGQDGYGTCAIWPMVTSGVAQNDAVQCVMTVNHPDPSTVLNRPNSGQVYNASSQQSGSGYGFANAFNGCPWVFAGYGLWVANTGGAGQWIAIDLGAAQTARSYEFNQGLTVPGQPNNFALTGWTLYGSNSSSDFTAGPPGGTWVAIDTRSSIPNTRTWAGNVTSTGSYRYYALRSNAISGVNTSLGYFRLFSSTMQSTMNFSEILAFGPGALGTNDSNGSSLAPAFMRGMTFEVSTNSGVSYTAITPIWRAHHGGIWVFPRQTGVTNIRITAQSGYAYFNFTSGGWTSGRRRSLLGLGPFQFVDYQRSDIDSTFAARLGSSSAADGTPTRGSFDSEFMGIANDSVSVAIDTTVSPASIGQQFLGGGNFNSGGNLSPVYGWWTFLPIPTGTISTFPNGYIRVHPVYGFVLFGGTATSHGIAGWRSRSDADSGGHQYDSYVPVGKACLTMPILQDHYFDPTAVGSNLAARGYGNLAGADVFFYISSTNELRVKQNNSATLSVESTIQILVSNVLWMSVIQQPPQGVVHLYWSTMNGAMFYAPYTARNFSEAVTTQPLPFSTAFTFSTTYAPNGTPPAYCMLVDDGTKHTLYTSATPNFSTLLGHSVVYNNNTNPAVYVNKPVLAVHPNDTNIATVNAQYISLPTPPGIQKVGFYVVTLPGVG